MMFILFSLFFLFFFIYYFKSGKLNKVPVKNICNVCLKPSKNKCTNCNQIYYCSKKCQKKDWKEHRKVCGTVGTELIIPTSSSSSEMREFISDLISDDVVENFNVPDFEQEYAIKYPHEKMHIQFLNSAQSSIEYLQLIGRFIDHDPDEPDPKYIMNRWNEFSEVLINFLTTPRKIGDIFTGKMKSQYLGGKDVAAQSFSSMSKLSLTYDQGKVHIAVGFVDLDLLLQAEITQNMNFIEQPNKFIGYEGSVYAVAKTNVIKEMMVKKVPIRSIIEVWFSSVWTMETLKYFEKAVKSVLQFGDAPNDGPPNPTKKELHPKVRSLISHWNKSIRSPKSHQEAHKLWTKTFISEDNVFFIVANLVEPRDRVQVARHILTGEFPLMDDQPPKNLIASITMFNCNNGILPHSSNEFMLQMMPMDTILSKNQRKEISFLNAIYNFLENAIIKVCNWLSPLEGQAGKIEIYLHFQPVTNDNSALLASIRQLDPWIMSWSNICDYFYVHDFHKMLRACSGNDTIHIMTSIDWFKEVFGAHIMEYDGRVRHGMLIDAQKKISMAEKVVDPSGYFQYTNVISHPYNIGDISAMMMVKENWQNYFFKDQDLNIGDFSFIPYAHTHKTHTLLNICYTYNKKD
ncbi:unnamed protein product [Rhizophagus irregularis]|uniref:MYND-type domain-containing protein n=1 Tax=Rhizophagus irregularis TaxID=588596 RepID=A0A916DY25_9GLOM|nr:unnamed protein product [Rhizophagus irregularis]